MVKINDVEYKLILLDTNVIRTIVNGFDPNHSDNNFAKKIVEYYLDDTMLCISAHSLAEFVRHTDIYNTFIEIFTVLPVIIILDYETILNEEKQAYQESREFTTKNVIYFCPPLENKLLKHMQTIDLNKLQDSLEIDCNNWNDNKLQLDRNISIKKLFVDSTRSIPKNSYADLTMVYSYLSRLYNKNPIVKNDVVDVKISTIAPYVDIIITEKSQAHIYREISKFISKMQEVTILTFRDINKLIKSNQKK